MSGAGGGTRARIGTGVLLAVFVMAVLWVPVFNWAVDLFILLLVAHSQFKTLDPRQTAALMPGRVAIDTVNCWEREAWEAAGFTLTRLGDRKHRPA